MGYLRLSLFILFLNLAAFGIKAIAAPVPWDGARQGQFIVALAQDGQGQVWVGTEDQGVWRYNPANAEQPWAQFTTKDGLGDDNAYAITVDKLNRVWVGHLNHGVSVYNGQRWANYGVLDGPLGERVFALATCPTDGDVWIASNAGLARYSLQQDTWSYFTRADGLVSDQIQALAFDRRGNLYAGTQCDGLAVAKAVDNYKIWQTVPGPIRPTSRPYGKGLPSALINAVLVAQDGTIYVATDAGLARSSDAGATWSYGRGKDWADKVKGRYGGPPNGWNAAEWKTDPNTQLAEDYCTCLAEDIAGKLWVGHRQQGFEVFDPQTSQRLHNGAQEKGLANPDDYVTTILPLPGQPPLIGRYGSGLAQSVKVFPNPVNVLTPQAPNAQQMQTRPPLPASAKAPNLAEFNGMLKTLIAVAANQATKQPAVVALKDDWITRGEWLGRYGRYWAFLAAMNSPRDYLWGATPEKIDYSVKVSSKFKHESVRHWIHWLFTKDSRVLELPTVYLNSRVVKKLTNGEENRRESELDDHGETYPMNTEGPNLYFTVKVPAGFFYLSLYEMNKDGHDSNNRYRDYKISIREHPDSQLLSNADGFEQQPELVNGRIKQFWGGVWKRFLVHGPSTLTIKVDRNYSFNTLLTAVMLDLLDETPPPYFTSDAEPAQTNGTSPKLIQTGLDAEAIANQAWLELEHIRLTDAAWWVQSKQPFYAAFARWYENALLHSPADKRLQVYERLGTCYYNLGLYARWEQCQKQRGLMPARDIEKSLRWDGKSSYSGKGYLTVMSYKADQALQPANKTAPTKPK